MTRPAGRARSASARRRPTPKPRAGRALRAVRRRRSPTSTATSSTSSSAASCARAAAATCCSRPRAPAAAATAPCPTATCRSPTSSCRRGQWDALQIPVSVAFFFLNSTLDRVAAFYPSPAGATESLLSLDTWDEVVGRQPRAGDAGARRRGVPRRAPTAARRRRAECFLVPIDACYELVGQLRRLWRGFDGGSEAHDALDAFFADVRARARPARRRGDAVSALVVRGARRPRRAARRGADADAAAARHRGRRASRSTPSRCGARSGSSRSGGATTPAEEDRLVELFGETPRWGDTLRPFLWTHVGITVTGFTGSTEVDLPVAVHLRLRGGRGQVPPRPRRRRDPDPAAVLRHRVPRRAARRASRPSRWRGTRRRRYRLPVRRVARRDGPLLPQQRLDAGLAATRSTRCTRFKAARALPDVGRGRRAAAEGSRRGGRVSDAPRSDRFAARPRRRRRRALRGLRPLPVPGLGPQEPAALAVRRARAAGLRRRRRAPSARRCAPRASSTPGPTPGARVRIRCLQVQHRAVEAARRRRASCRPTRSTSTASRWVPWDEAVEHEVDLEPVSTCCRVARRAVVERRRRRCAAGDEHRAAARRRRARSSAGPCAARERGRRAWSGSTAALGRRRRGAAEGDRRRSRTRTGWRRGAGAPTATRSMRRSLVAVHTLLAVDDGAFVSLLDPPDVRARRPWPAAATTARSRCSSAPDGRRRRACCRRRSSSTTTRRSRPRAPGDFCDATEIDEILALRVLTLTDDEKAEARGTDPRAGGDRRPLRRHAARGVGAPARRGPLAATAAERADDAVAEPEPLPWWDPGVDGEVDPWTDTTWIGGVEVGKGTPRPPPPLPAGRRPRPLPRRPDGDRGRRLPRRRRRRARRRHARRRPRHRDVRVAAAATSTSTPTRSRCCR